MKKKTKICIVTWFCCLRNIKLAIGAWRNGYELELITKYTGLNLMWELEFLHIFKSVRIWDTPSQCEAYMRESDADVIWCHNEPDVMAYIANDPSIKRDRLVLHDCHDMPTLHPDYQKRENNKNIWVQIDEVEKQEKVACCDSDFVFVPTQAYVELIKEKYGRDKGVFVEYSCSPGMFFPRTDMPRVNGLLYCGQVNVPEMNSKLTYRNCLPLFYKLTELGVASHIYYTTPTANMQSYLQSGATIHGTLKMFAAIHQYTRYDYGFVGSNENCLEIQMCRPNKEFDCIAAGIPLVCLNAGAAGKHAVEKDIGVSIQGLENLKDVPWGDVDFWEKKRKNVRVIRYKYTAEKEVRKVFDKVGI